MHQADGFSERGVALSLSYNPTPSTPPGTRLDGEVGCGVLMGSRFVGTPRVGFSTSEYGRDYRLGYRLGMLDRERLHVELGVDAQRRESPLQGGASTGALGRATVRW